MRPDRATIRICTRRAKALGLPLNRRAAPWNKCNVGPMANLARVRHTCQRETCWAQAAFAPPKRTRLRQVQRRAPENTDRQWIGNAPSPPRYRGADNPHRKAQIAERHSRAPCWELSPVAFLLRIPTTLPCVSPCPSREGDRIRARKKYFTRRIPGFGRSNDRSRAVTDGAIGQRAPSIRKSPTSVPVNSHGPGGRTCNRPSAPQVSLGDRRTRV